MVETLERRGIGIISLTESIDTASAGGQLIFHIFAAIAQFEKSLIRERKMAGLAAAKGRGKLPGHKPSLSADECEEIRVALSNGACVREVARKYEVHPRTVVRGVERLA